MDYNLDNNETGADYIKKLKKDGFEKINFITITSLNPIDIRDEVNALGCYALVNKDDTMINKLVRRINELKEELIH